MRQVVMYEFFINFASKFATNKLITTNKTMKINDYNFAGKKAIVRVDFNVPLQDSNAGSQAVIPHLASVQQPRRQPSGSQLRTLQVCREQQPQRQ